MCALLGYGAVEFLLNPNPSSRVLPGALVCLVDGELKYLDFTSLQDSNTGKTRVRSVGITKPTYKVAREYMIRLEHEDFADSEKLRLLAQAASSKDKLCSPEEFKSRLSIFGNGTSRQRLIDHSFKTKGK